MPSEFRNQISTKLVLIFEKRCHVALIDLKHSDQGWPQTSVPPASSISSAGITGQEADLIGCGVRLKALYMVDKHPHPLLDLPQEQWKLK